MRGPNANRPRPGFSRVAIVLLAGLASSVLSLNVRPALGPAAASAAEAARLDWSRWRAIPVYHDGRIMPLDTFARLAVETICNRERPKLRLAGAVPPEEFESAALAGARTLFPGDQPRTFDPVELLFSWFTEPEKWEDVPFLIAEHNELREQIIGLPSTNEEGEHLKYISPRQFMESDGLAAWLEEASDRERQARAEGRALEFSGVDSKANDLFAAYRLFRLLTFSPTLDLTARGSFQQQLEVVLETWQQLEPELALFSQVGEKGGLDEQIARAQQALAELHQAANRANVPFAAVEPPAAALTASARVLAEQFAAFQQRLTEQPPEWSADQLQKARATMAQLTIRMRRLADQADQLELSFYKNDSKAKMCVVPAMRPDALEADRDTGVPPQPWLDLQTLLTGSPRVLRDYPAAEVAAVRAAFEQFRRAYLERAERPNDFVEFQARFADSLYALGTAIEPRRLELPIKNRDADQIAYTAYPPVGFTSTEVRYNHLQPFLWSWVISLLATSCFVLMLIGIRSPRVYWTGITILGIGLIWAAYGFGMRVAITGWAPVTNMYETVVFVPFIVSLMGAWFALLPLTWNGLVNAWRMTELPLAQPRFGEGHTPTGEQLDFMPAARWRLARWLLVGPRLALTALAVWMLSMAPYAAGDRTVINLLPNVAVEQSLPTGNDLLTWLTGLCVLVPTAWFAPRLVLAGVLAPVVIPLTVRRTQGGSRRALMPQVIRRWPFGLAATFVAFFGAFIAWYSPVLDGEFKPLQPVLRDNFWLLIHVLTIVSSYGAGALAWGLGNIALGYYLLGRYRNPSAGEVAAAQRMAALGHTPTLARHAPEPCSDLASFVYKSAQVAVVLLAAGTILGALWADVAWGRFWGWDPKEVWALISLLVYLAFLHARLAGLVGNFGLCAGAVAGATAIIMSWYGVNFYLGVGLHSYGFGAGGQWWVMGAVAVNWAFLGAATLRYMAETRPRPFDPDRQPPEGAAALPHRAGHSDTASESGAEPARSSR